MNNEKLAGGAFSEQAAVVPSSAPAAASGPPRQVDILADAFDRGEKLTVLTALQKYGIYALSQRCGELAKWYPVESRPVRLPSGKNVSEYFRGGIAHG